MGASCPAPRAGRPRFGASGVRVGDSSSSGRGRTRRAICSGVRQWSCEDVRVIRIRGLGISIVASIVLTLALNLLLRGCGG
jgi:hypothetical protein